MTYQRATWEEKLRALSDEDLQNEREKTLALVLFWKNDPTRNKHYSTKLALIDDIKEARP